MAALATLLKVQPDLQRDLSASPFPDATRLGAIAGLCLAAPLVWEDVVRRLLLMLPRRTPRWIFVVTVALSVPNFLAVIFARALIAVLVLFQLLSTSHARL
jgi:hypothetical protein